MLRRTNILEKAVQSLIFFFEARNLLSCYFRLLTNNFLKILFTCILISCGAFVSNILLLAFDNTQKFIRITIVTLDVEMWYNVVFLVGLFYIFEVAPQTSYTVVHIMSKLNKH